MASNSQAQGRRTHLARSNSSFLDAIKNIVTAPLSWLAGNDHYQDSNGKRRRLPIPDSSLPSDDDHLSSHRPKRPRIDGPPPSTGYLDPPSHVFKHSQQSIQDSSYNNSTISMSNSVRSTLSPLRSLGISRTMSVDPPGRSLRRESALAQISARNDSSVGSAKRTRPSAQRDRSMPPMPLSTRPSLLMRSSLTPQPSQPPPREASEPPPLSSLAINPVFVRAPSSQPIDSQRRSTPSQTVTLGSLADSTRNARSPIRQHSSLLFSTSPSTKTQTLHQPSPAEKALHELDIYKTPLLPTRLRSSTDTAQSTGPFASSGIPDLFKPRRSQKLVLMQDEKPSTRLGAQARKVPLANDTKPYAGEGGMKKLLARRRLEVEEEEEHSQVTQDIKSEAMDEGADQASEPAVLESKASRVEKKTDWSPAASSQVRPSSVASSLRVGRDKKRNHIARPKARSVGSKFSAAFDEDLEEMMDDEAADLETKPTVPVKPFIFTPPPGFSFSPSVQDDSSDSKELPIPVLPFSLTRKSQDVPVGAPKPDPLSSTTTENTPSSTQAMSSGVGVDAKSLSSDQSVPNFFANSKLLSKPVDVSVPSSAFRLMPVLTGNETVQSASPGLTSSLVPPNHAGTIKGETDLSAKLTFMVQESAPAPVFNPEPPPSNGIISPRPEPLPTIIPAISVCLPTTSNVTTQMPIVEVKETVDAIVSAGAGEGPTAVASNDTSDNVMTPISPEETVSQVVPSTTNAVEPMQPASNQSLGFLNGSKNDRGAKSPFGHIVNQPSSSSEALKLPGTTPSFSFSQQATNVEAPKPTFMLNGESISSKNIFGGFASGQATVTADKDKARGTSEIGFAFGTASPTPSPSEQKKASPPFAFGLPQLQTPASTTANIFSFGGGGTVASDVSKPFVFGATTVAQPERPVTPPKAQDQEVQMEESPTREIQPLDGKSPMALGFSFGTTTTAPTSLFGGQNDGNGGTLSPFTFGSNAFATPAKQNKDVQDKAAGFLQTPTFPFGQSKTLDVAAAAQSPTSAPFSFGSGATTFSFGAQDSSPFGQSHGNSAPSSPATFGTAPFSFGMPTTSNTAFAFGSSQPASPAGGNNLVLPQPASSSGFGGTNFGQSAPPSPFSAPSPLTPTAASAPLFTIGAAPTSTPRQIKKLPTRRGGAKR